jgi:type I restriction enzyme, S subunit
MRLDEMPLACLASVRSGGGAPQDPEAFTTTGFPFVRAGSLPRLLDGMGESCLERLEPQVAKEYGLHLFPAGTVLFAKSGMSATKGHVYRLKSPAYVVNHLAALVPHAIEDSAFLARALQRFSPTSLIKDAAYPSIRLGDIENMKVLAPQDSSGRRRIAEVLDKADTLRAKRRATLAQLDTLTQSIFLDMFGDPAANRWPMTTVADVAADVDGAIRTGPFGSQLLHGEFTKHGIAVLGIDNAVENEFQWVERRFISEAKYRQLKRYTVRPGDILITIMGTCGRCAIVPNDSKRLANT